MNRDRRLMFSYELQDGDVVLAVEATGRSARHAEYVGRLFRAKVRATDSYLMLIPIKNINDTGRIPYVGYFKEMTFELLHRPCLQEKASIH